MKYFLLFAFVVYVPFWLLHFYLKDNSLYQKYPRNVWNSIGYYLACGFFIFVLTAPNFVPKFYEEINTGWILGSRNRVPGEVVFVLLWLVTLTMMTFPHVYKRFFMKHWPTGIQLSDEFNPINYRVGSFGLLIIVLLWTYDICV